MRNLRFESLKRATFLGVGLCFVALAFYADPRAAARSDQHLLYVATPGIRNYVEYGGHRSRRVRHRQRPPIREADSHVRPGRRGGPRERQGHRGQREDRTCLRLDDQTARRASISITGSRVWVREYEGGVRPHGALAGREDPLPPVPRRTSLARRRRDERRCLTKVVTDSGAHNTIYGPRWPARVPRRTAVANARRRRSAHAYRRRRRRTVQRSGSSLHDQRAADAVLRQRQRSPGLRGRRHQDRERSCIAWRCRATRTAR